MSLAACQVVPGFLRGAGVRGDEDGPRLPHRRLLILSGVLRHHCRLCLPVFPHGHRRLHLLSEQVPREHPRAAHREYSRLSSFTHLSRLVLSSRVIMKPELKPFRGQSQTGINESDWVLW